MTLPTTRVSRNVGLVNDKADELRNALNTFVMSSEHTDIRQNYFVCKIMTLWPDDSWA